MGRAREDAGAQAGVEQGGAESKSVSTPFSSFKPGFFLLLLLYFILFLVVGSRLFYFSSKNSTLAWQVTFCLSPN